MRLGDVCSKIGSGATPKGGKEAYKSSGIPLIRSQNVLDWSFTNNGLAFIDETQATALANVEVKPCDILLNITGDSVARACMVPDWCTPARVNQHVSIVRPSPALDPTFLLCFLQSSKPLLLKLASSGATRNALTKGMIGDLEIELPSIETQRAIASLIGLIQQKLALNQQANDYLEELVVAMFGKFYMSKWGNELPEGWSYQRVDDIAEKVAMGPFGSNIKVDTFVDEGVSIISGAHLKGLLLEESNYNHITEEHASRLHNSMVYPGDIVFTHAGNIGQASLITEWSNEQRYIISQRQFYLRCDKSKLLPEIPALYFHTRIGKHVLTANSTSTGVPSIAQPSSYLKSIELLVPDMPSQHRFVKTIKPLLQSIVANRNETDCLDRLRNALLPKLMSGEIDVSQVKPPTQPNNHLCAG
ncbi:restriction endonuclease subunit S [Collinsella ihumii]|uniref:restriction endonuclease subunit S n=1 Tax=Collinsella ihumii TaxID=1720204 RepID=UPI0025AA6C6A|nr:restriction endonuclease subunit S [Collinsella ihumii]MDN0055602.1 restriction endonuclease subunit S [Collinsella ihumii]